MSSVEVCFGRVECIVGMAALVDEISFSLPLLPPPVRLRFHCSIISDGVRCKTSTILYLSPILKLSDKYFIHEVRRGIPTGDNFAMTYEGVGADGMLAAPFQGPPPPGLVGPAGEGCTGISAPAWRPNTARMARTEYSIFDIDIFDTPRVYTRDTC